MSPRSSPAARTIVALTAIVSLFLVGSARSAPQPRVVDPLTVLAKAQNGKTVPQRRKEMVEQIRADLRAAAQIADTPAFEAALGIIGSLPREQFVRRNRRNAAYVDLPQEIGYGQTISDPYVVAVMTGALDLPSDANVLDVGTGSGYQAAVLARIAKRVSSIEIVKPLAISAAKRLKRLDFLNVEVRSGDGFLGWPEHAQFDGIVVAASASAVPTPLLDQLKLGGRLIMPIGPSGMSTQLLRITKKVDGSTERCALGGALFVPLTSTHTKPFARAGLFDRSIPLCFEKPVVWVF